MSIVYIGGEQLRIHGKVFDLNHTGKIPKRNSKYVFINMIILLVYVFEFPE